MARLHHFSMVGRPYGGDHAAADTCADSGAPMKAAVCCFHDTRPQWLDFEAEVLRGFASLPKQLPPKFFYDERGSRLFEQICQQPEYYPTRIETRILQTCAPELARLTGPGTVLIELGSGASFKVRVLLESLRPRAYVGIDISRNYLLESTQRLASDYPCLEVHAVCTDFSRSFILPALPAGPRVAFYPGSSIGNFELDEAVAFLRNLRPLLGSDGALLIGVDVKKDASLLHAAYNDAAGITAEFNLNVLRRLQLEMGAELDLGAFRHTAFYNEGAGRVEMHLESVRPQTVRIGARSFTFGRGERLHTENSYKYSVPEFQRLAREAGFHPVHVWVDAMPPMFSVHYLRVGRL